MASIQYEENRDCSGTASPDVAGQPLRPAKQLYSLGEAAVFLGCSTWSVRNLIHSRKIETVRYGKKFYLDFEDLEKFIRTNKSLFDNKEE